MAADAIHQKFQHALDALIRQVKEDHSVLAVLLCGSLAHDTVWVKSDIDLVLVTIDDRKVETRGLALYADGVNVHACLLPRAEFRKLAEGVARNSFFHSYLSKGRLLYTHDPTIAEMCATLHEIGRRDTQVQLLRSATQAIPAIDKAHKWLVTRGDLDYTALWILHAATPLAQIEVIGAGLLADREVLLQALERNPTFFKTIYTDLLNTKKTRPRLQAALDAIDDYLAERSGTLFELVVDYLRDVGETRSCTEIEGHFQRNFDVTDVTTVCEYLADRGRIGKASTPVLLTKRSRVQVQEMAFFYTEEPSHDVPIRRKAKS